MKIKFDEILIVDNNIIYVIVYFGGKRIYYYLANKGKKILKRIGPIPSRKCYNVARKIFFEKKLNCSIKNLIRVNKSELLQANIKIKPSSTSKKTKQMFEDSGIRYLQHGFILITDNKGIKVVKDIPTALRQQMYISKAYNRDNPISTKNQLLLDHECNRLEANLKNATAYIGALVNRKEDLIEKHREDIAVHFITIKKFLESLWPAPYYYRAREALTQIKRAKKCFNKGSYGQMKRDLEEAHRWLLEY